jgi:hypothetical protein
MVEDSGGDQVFGLRRVNRGRDGSRTRLRIGAIGRFVEGRIICHVLLLRQKRLLFRVFGPEASNLFSRAHDPF